MDAAAHHRRAAGDCGPSGRAGKGVGKGTRDSAEVVRAAADAVLLDDDLLARRPGEVSDGQLQRAIVARGIAQRPAFFICDEPTSMLDPITTAAIVAALRDIAAGGAGVLLISHDLRLLRAVADRGYVVEGGKVTPDRELAG